VINKWIATSLVLALIGALSFAQPVADGAIAEGEYANTLVHAESGATLYWTIEGENLHMGFSMSSGGWAGIGWLKEQTNRKAGGDILIVTEKDGAFVHYDMVQLAARGEPALDTAEGGSDSYTEMAITRAGDVWTVEFVRPLVTGEETDIDIVEGEEYLFMVAFANVMDVGRAHARSTSGGAFYIEKFIF
jgi:hypothetical protein